MKCLIQDRVQLHLPMQDFFTDSIIDNYGVPVKHNTVSISVELIINEYLFKFIIFYEKYIADVMIVTFDNINAHYIFSNLRIYIKNSCSQSPKDFFTTNHDVTLNIFAIATLAIFSMISQHHVL